MRTRFFLFSHFMRFYSFSLVALVFWIFSRDFYLKTTLSQFSHRKIKKKKFDIVKENRIDFIKQIKKIEFDCCMSSNTSREQNLIQIKISIFNELLNAIFDQHMIQNVIKSFHCFVNSRVIKNNLSIFCFKQFERLIHCENSQKKFFVNDDFFKCFIIAIYIVDHELNQDFENNFWYCSSNESFDAIIYNNHNLFVFCFDNEQKIDEIQISSLK